MTTTERQLVAAATRARRLANGQRFEDYQDALTDLGRAYLKRYPLAAHEAAATEPLTDDEWRTRDSSDTDEGCAALRRAHGVGASGGEVQQ